MRGGCDRFVVPIIGQGLGWTLARERRHINAGCVMRFGVLNRATQSHNPGELWTDRLWVISLVCPTRIGAGVS